MRRAILAALLAMCWIAACAPIKPSPAAPAAVPGFVSVFVYFDRCNRNFVMAAFVRADGSVVETTDMPQTKAWAEGIPQDHGRLVPLYVKPCVEEVQ